MKSPNGFKLIHNPLILAIIGAQLMHSFDRNSLLWDSRLVDGWTREISIQRKGDATTCAVVNQLWAWLFATCKNKFPIHQQLFLQLVDKSNLPLYTDFPGWNSFVQRIALSKNKIVKYVKFINLSNYVEFNYSSKFLQKKQIWQNRLSKYVKKTNLSKVDKKKTC